MSSNLGVGGGLDPFAPFEEALTATLAGLAGAGPHAAQAALHLAGLSDGLPVVVPDAASLAAMLGGRNPRAGAIERPLPVAYVIPTWWDVAAAAVLAGCPPEPALLEVVRAALEAVADDAWNLLGVQTTTGAAAPLVIVHGPVVDRLGLHAGSGVLGPAGARNGPLGRAVRLVLQNVGQARQGETDMATHGHPGKLTWLVAEHQEVSPWSPLAAARGLAADASAVTVFPGVGNVEVVLPSSGPEEIADRLAQVLVGLACPAAVLLLPPESAVQLQRGGWGREALAAGLLARGAAEVLVVVTGGVGVKATVVPRWGAPCDAVTCVIDEEWACATT